MKKYLLFSLLVMAGCLEASAIHRYRLYLADKEGSVQYPLSERALERRARQGIALDSTDLEVSPTYIAALQEAGYEVLLSSRWLNTVVVRNANGTPVDSSAWNDFSFVTHYQLLTTNENVQAPRRMPQSDPGSGLVPDNFRTPIKECKGQALLNNGYRGQDMLVAVLDAGFVNANQLEATRNKIVGSYDMLCPNDPDYLFTEDETHGVKCLSIMCTDESLGVWGSAPDASYFIIRTECSPSETAFEEDTWVAGAEYADSIGADVISSSLGYFTFDNKVNSHSQSQLKGLEVFVSQGADKAAHKGMLVCVAAGNERGTSWNAIDFPANVPDVLAVGATDPKKQMAYFSSPGFTVPYVKPDVVCRGQDSYMINPYNGQVTQGDGTSFATPMMAGLCTSLWSAAPDLTSLELLAIVRKSSSHYETPDSLSGYGFPNFEVALSLAGVVTDMETISTHEDLRWEKCYDLQGRPLSNPRKNSLFISQKGGKVAIVRE